MVKSIIFDFDGVILESADIKTEAFRRLFEERFPDSVDQIVEYHKKNMGISRFVKFKQIYERFANKSLATQEEVALEEKFSGIIFDRILKTPMVPGAIEFLKENQKNYILIVASGTPKEELIDIMKKRNLLHYFKEVFGSPQEKVEIIRHIIKKYGLNPSEIVFVGDAESDYNAAKTTGVRFIAKIAHFSDSNLKQGTHYISNLNEMNQALDKLNKGLYANKSR